jgi:poly-gamma-glutamate synthesis protein (capsule biosynthesis protein)
VPNASHQGIWTYAVAAPFFTVDEEIASQDLGLAWSGVSTGTLINRPILVATSTLQTLEGMDSIRDLWGTRTGENIQTTSATEILTAAQQNDAWAILPFHALTPQWKTLRIDGLSLVEKGLSPGTYPLEVPLSLGSASRPDALNFLSLAPDALTNRREDAMTIVAMTGVTALTRGTGRLMDTKGITYPGLHIRDWLITADFVHISNEVSFKPDCIAGPSGTMSFCSHDSYIGLLEYVGANVIELTGNHLADKGSQWISHSLQMYQERGWHWFGGGANVTEATRPLTLTHGPNHIAFLGCNPIGPAYDLATEDRPGAAPCDYERMQAQVQQLRAAGYNPIVTLQYLEAYEYAPTPQQIRDFRAFAEAGATMVQGSQAHQAQTMEFYQDTFIHYGLGNFFFDQMWSAGTRQEFVDRLIFYDGKLLNIDLRPAILEEYGQPRPMTADYPDPAGRRPEFLQMIFELSP